MLKVLRENVKYLSWILWVFIALLILFIFDFSGSMRQSDAGGAIVATVGGEQVNRQEFERQVRQLTQQAAQMYGDRANDQMLKQLHLPARALDKMVTDIILLDEARRVGLKVGDQELREQILQAPYFQDDAGNFSEARYTETLQRASITPAAFEQEMRRDILLQKLQRTLAADAYVSDDELEKAYREQVEKAKIRYLEVPRTASPTKPSPAEVAAYFQAHKQELRLPEQRQAAYLVVDASKLREQVKIADADVQAYYDQHRAEFTQQEQVRARQILLNINDKRPEAQARQELEAIRKRIAGGEDFGTVARQVSEDPASKPNGGDMGYFGRGRNVKEFEDAAFNAKPGQLVGPVKSPFAYHLIEVTDRKPGGLQPVAQVADQIRFRLMAEKSQELASAKAKDLAQQAAKDKPKDEAAFRALGAGVPGVASGTTPRFAQADPLFDPKDPAGGLGYAPQVASAAFALKQGEVSDALQTSRGWAVIYLTQVFPAHLPELPEVEAKVTQVVSTQKDQEAAMARAATAAQEIAHGKTLDQAAAALGLAAKDSPEFGGQGVVPGIGYSPQLVKAVLAKQPGQVGGPVPDARGAVVFQVLERKSWEPAKFAQEKDQLRTRLQGEKLSRLLGTLLEQRKRDLGVTYNPKLLEYYGIAGAAAQS
jgi:peptidyl-prolyl cis-trans isomerase D